MLAKFNLDSLYVNLLKRRDNELEWSKIKSIKNVIVHCIFCIVLSVILAIAGNLNGFLAMLLINFFAILLDYRMLRKMLLLAKTDEVDEILYGKSYANIYVNEEKLANLLGSLDKGLGIFLVMPDCIYHMTLMQIIFFFMML